MSELRRIRSLLAQALAAVDDAISKEHQADGESAVVVGHTVWRKQELVQFVAKVVHLPAAKSLFALCSSRPGDWVTYDEVLAAARHKEPKQARNELSAMTRHLNKMKGSTDSNWPVETELAPVLRYRADARMAKWIRKALDAAAP